MRYNINFDIELPTDLSFLETSSFLLLFSLAILLISLLARLFLGKESSLRTSMVCGLSMIMMYAICTVIYTFSPRDFTVYLNHLPLGVFGFNDAGEKVLVLNTFQQLDFPELCHQIMRIFLLAFLVNQINNFTPGSLKLTGWILFHIFSLVLGIGLYYILDQVIDTYLPFIYSEYTPLILLSLLCFSFLMGLLKLLFGALMATVNPLLAALYTFFFTQKTGKTVSRAIGSTLVIMIFTFTLDYLGYGVIPVGAEALTTYVPVALCMFLLWVLVGRIL
ncbi:MAG: hypothetical protein E7465_08830 [Ruminococcaceae bacterium]|nr:hypothetical protein [Oscillospiraceae bacterium]